MTGVEQREGRALERLNKTLHIWMQLVFTSSSHRQMNVLQVTIAPSQSQLQLASTHQGSVNHTVDPPWYSWLIEMKWSVCVHRLCLTLVILLFLLKVWFYVVCVNDRVAQCGSGPHVIVPLNDNTTVKISDAITNVGYILPNIISRIKYSVHPFFCKSTTVNAKL